MGYFEKLRCSRKNVLWSEATTDQFIMLCWTSNPIASIFWRAVVALHFLSHMVHNYYMIYAPDSGVTLKAFLLAFLTQWGELCNNIYAITSVCVVVYCKFNKNISMEQEAPNYLKFVGFLWEIQSTVAITITVVYFALLKVKWTYFSINLHLINSVVTVIDMFMIGTPKKFYHVWLPQILAIGYIITNASIWMASDKIIYPAINWGTDTAKSVGIAFFVVCLVVPILHGFLCLLTVLRDFLISKYGRQTG